MVIVGSAVTGRDRRAAMGSDDDLRALKNKLEEVLGKENATTLMILLVGEYQAA
jgi:hypothetical protein